MVRQTSIEAHAAIQVDGVAATQVERIINYLERHANVTRREIARATGIEVSAVAGRVNTLVASDVLVEHSSRKCSISGRNAHTVSLK